MDDKNNGRSVAWHGFAAEQFAFLAGEKSKTRETKYEEETIVALL